MFLGFDTLCRGPLRNVLASAFLVCLLIAVLSADEVWRKKARSLVPVFGGMIFFVLWVGSVACAADSPWPLPVVDEWFDRTAHGPMAMALAVVMIGGPPLLVVVLRWYGRRTGGRITAWVAGLTVPPPVRKGWALARRPAPSARVYSLRTPLWATAIAFALSIVGGMERVPDPGPLPGRVEQPRQGVALFDPSSMTTRSTTIILDGIADEEPLHPGQALRGWVVDERPTSAVIDDVMVWLTDPDGWEIVLLGRAAIESERRATLDEDDARAFYAAEFTLTIPERLHRPTSRRLLLVIGARAGADWSYQTWDVAPAGGGDTPVRRPAVSLPAAVARSTTAGEFLELTGDGFRLRYQPGVAAERVAAALTALHLASRRAPELTGLPRPGEVSVYLAATSAEYRRIGGVLGHSSTKTIETSSGVYVRKAYAPGPAIFIDIGILEDPTVITKVVVHEYTHHLLADANGGRSISSWADEGLADTVAQILTGEQFPDALGALSHGWYSYVERARAQGKLPRLARWDFGYQSSDTLRYAHGYAAINILTEEVGLPAVARAIVDTDGRLRWTEEFARQIGRREEDLNRLVTTGLDRRLPMVYAARRDGAVRLYLLVNGLDVGARWQLRLTAPDGQVIPHPGGHVDADGLIDIVIQLPPGSAAGAWQVDILDGAAGFRHHLSVTVP